MHKRRAVGGKKKSWRKKRKYELGRQLANTKLSSNKTVRKFCVRDGNVKWRALRLDSGNYSWGSEAVTRKTRILDVVHNASNNELVRTQTLVKSAIVQVDVAPFKQWYLQHYGVDIGGRRRQLPRRILHRRVTQQQKKPKRVTMFIENWRSTRKIATLRSCLVVGVCLLAFPLDLVNVAELMAIFWKVKSWNFT